MKKEKADRMTISMPPGLRVKADQRASELEFPGFSDYIQYLIRKDFFENGGGKSGEMMLAEEQREGQPKASPRHEVKTKRG